MRVPERKRAESPRQETGGGLAQALERHGIGGTRIEDGKLLQQVGTGRYQRGASRAQVHVDAKQVDPAREGLQPVRSGELVGMAAMTSRC